VVDSNDLKNPEGFTQALSHEVGHALYTPDYDFSSRDSFLNSTLSDEGAATLKNIKVRREVIENGGSDISIAGNSTNQPAYNTAYDIYLKDGDAKKARETIGKVYGKGERTSTDQKSYEDYYGGWYDKRYSAKNQYDSFASPNRFSMSCNTG